VPRAAALSVTFTKPMEPRSTGEAISIAPRVDVRRVRWRARTATIELAETLGVNRTYTLFVGAGARDHHGNALPGAAAITFSTADSFPPGEIAGEIEARGFPAPGTALWVYGGGRAPDSTARDFDALGVADAEGRFRIAGLPVPASYRLWAFADLNRNRSFEPATDVLAAVDTTLSLSRELPGAPGLVLRIANPRAPGKVRGVVADSAGDTLGVVRLVATSERDTSLRVSAEADAQGTFVMELAAGAWSLRAWRDADRNRAWRVDLEPASAPIRLEVEPASEISDLKLALRRRGEGP
jgi:hypothetical protein